MIHTTGFIYTVVENLVISTWLHLLNYNCDFGFLMRPICNDSHKGIANMFVPNLCSIKSQSFHCMCCMQVYQNTIVKLLQSFIILSGFHTFISNLHVVNSDKCRLIMSTGVPVLEISFIS